MQYFKRSTMYFMLKYPLKCSEVCFEVQRSAYFAALGLHCRRTWVVISSGRSPNVPCHGPRMYLAMWKATLWPVLDTTIKISANLSKQMDRPWNLFIKKDHTIKYEILFHTSGEDHTHPLLAYYCITGKGFSLICRKVAHKFPEMAAIQNIYSNLI